MEGDPLYQVWFLFLSVSQSGMTTGRWALDQEVTISKLLGETLQRLHFAITAIFDNYCGFHGIQTASSLLTNKVEEQ